MLPRNKCKLIRNLSEIPGGNLKINSVVLSCSTEFQIESAARYVYLARRSRIISFEDAVFYHGFLVGLLAGIRANNTKDTKLFTTQEIFGKLLSK